MRLIEEKVGPCLHQTHLGHMLMEEGSRNHISHWLHCYFLLPFPFLPPLPTFLSSLPLTSSVPLPLNSLNQIMLLYSNIICGSLVYLFH